MTLLHETAYAKLNLALHVRARREDGYHELETLFAFCEHGDVLSAEPAERDEVRTLGEFGGNVGDPGDNLVHTTDFRRVYATMIDGWLAQKSGAQILGGEFAPFQMFA